MKESTDDFNDHSLLLIFLVLRLSNLYVTQTVAQAMADHWRLIVGC